jgi:AAA+ superfamily predicted ATPase
MTQLPPWAQQLRAQYLAGESSMFLLHGNVRDLQCWHNEDGTTAWCDLRTFLEKFLSATREVVVYYNVSQGLRFSKTESAKTFKDIVNKRRLLRGDDVLTKLPVTSTAAIPVIEDLITDPDHSSAVIMDFFEMIGPSADPAFMSHDDKANLVSLQRWSSDPAFARTDNLIILITEQISEINRRISSSTSLEMIQIPFPEVDQREAFVKSQDLTKINMIEPPVFAKMTAGLTLLQIRNILRSAVATGAPINFADISARKKKIIEQECQGLVEFIPPRHNFTHVGGMERIKEDLTKVAEAVKHGNRSRVPMGMIFVGPMGTGKTFLAEAFATESGLTCLKLKNFRDKYVGQTEANLEKVLGLVEALGYVLLIVDEADRGLSGGEDSSGVDSRVIARLKEFMSDTSHRGRVIILMMTNRPDKLDVDLKRPGRFDLKIPFFFPESSEEREGIFEALVRKNKLAVAKNITYTTAALETEGYSGAEIEAVLLAAASLAGDTDSDAIQQEHLDTAARDVIPSRDAEMLEYMEMLAVFETSAKRMLPERYQGLSSDEVQQRVNALRIKLGRRAS